MVDTIRPRLFLWDDLGAPTLTGAAGKMVDLLYACLVTGYNEKSVTSATRDASVVTLDVGADHGFRKGHWIEVSGADQTEYNGIFEVIEKLSTTIKFEMAAAPVTPATGTILVRVASTGWERTFVSGDGLRAAFKQVPIDSTQHYLYVDDTNADSARYTKLSGYKTMLDIDTGEDPFPFTGVTEQYVYWYKSDDETTARRWSLVSDDRFFWINWNVNTDYEDGHDWRLNCFGDIKTFVPNDQWYCIINGSLGVGNEHEYQGFVVTFPQRPYEYVDLYYGRGSSFARSFNGIDVGIPLLGALFPSMGSIYTRYSDWGIRSISPPGHDGIAWPSPVDGGTVIHPMYSIEGYRNRSLIRGQLPGCYGVCHGQPFQSLAIRSMTGQMSGRSFINYRLKGGCANTYDAGSTEEGQVLIDIKDKWR